MKMIYPAFLVSKLPVEPLRGHSAWRLLLAVLMPVFAAVLQWLLWPYLPPLTWLFLYPAVFISAWVGGFIGGLMATGVAITIGIYVFIPIQWSWVIQDPRHLYSALVFGVMGVMFSVVHGLLQTAYAQLRQIGAHNLDVSQSRLRLALEAAEAGLWEWDVRTNRNEWSSNLWGLYGLVPGSAEPSYELWLSSVHPDDREAVLKRLNEAVQSGTGIVLEWRVAGCPPGQERWLMSRGQADADADGAVTLYRGIVIDISSRKKLEQHLQDSGQRLNFALSTLQVGAWELDLLTHQSQRTALHDQIFGYSTPLDSWTYEQFLEHVVPEDRLGVHSCFQEATQIRSDWDFECRIRRADGVVRWIRAKGGHRLDPQGEPLLLAGIVEDIQNRKEAEQALVRKDQELLETQRLAGLGNWRWEVATDTHTWSEETYRIYGLDPALPALTYPAVQRLFTPETWAQLTAAVETALAAGLPYECDAEVLRADGGRRWITARGMAVRAADGTITSLYGTVQDITGRKQAELAAQLSEQALAASEREFRWLAESMPQIVWATDRDGLTYYFNSQWREYTGLGLAESYGDGWSIPFHPAERQQAIAAWHQAVHHNSAYSLEARLRRADGEYRWWLVRGVPVLDGSGAIYKWFGTCTDIHELKQAEESIRASEAYYRLIFVANPMPIYILDYETLMFLDVNSAALLKYGYTREEFLALNIRDLRPESEVERTLSAIEKTLSQFDQPLHLGEWLHKKKDGTLLWAQINVHPLTLNGRPAVLVLAHDVTEQKQAQQLLQESEARWQFALEGSDLGVWDWNLVTGKVYFSKRWKTMLGYDEDEIADNFDEWASRLLPDDLERALAAVRRHCQGETAYYQCEYPMRNRQGDYQWMLDRGKVVSRSADGEPLRMIGTHYDMTEHRRLLESLRASENLTRSVMNSLDSSIAVLDEQGTIIHVNQYGQNFSAAASQQDIGLNYFVLCRHSADQQQATQILEGLQAVLNGRQARFSQEFLLSIGDRPRWFRLDVVPLQGTIKGLVTHLIDISGRKAIEDSLREQERLLAASQAIAHIGSWLLDIKTGQLRWSEETFRLFGLSSATDAPPNKEAFGELVYSDDRMAVQAWREALIAGGEPVSLEFRSRPINGQYRWLLAFAELEKDADGVPLRMIGAVQDITAQKRTAAELQRWADAFHYCAHGIVIGNPLTNGISFCNPAFASMQGYGDPSELVGLPIAALYPPEERAAIKPHLQVADTLGWISFESRYQRKDGSEFDVQVDLVSVKDDAGTILYRVATVQDISLRKHSEAELLHYHDHLEQLVSTRTEELQLAREEAERLSQVKTSFLANMSHEIRSPMNAVLGFCYLLEQQPLDNEVRQLVYKIHRAGRSLLAIINDVLDFSKIEAGRLEMEQVPFRLSDILDDLAALMSSAANDKAIELVITPAPSIDGLIGDGLRLQQVLVNLLSNAIKFTEQGEVVLRVSLETETSEQVSLRFGVHDTGIGISPEQQQEIFAAFSQADNSISRRFGGSGLGLAISQELVRLMGGALQVDSEIGRGSVFWFVLPLTKDPQWRRTPAQLTNLALLVADDSATAREALALTAHSLGWIAETVSSGPAALAHILVRQDSPKPYDVILLDWKMPGQDGLLTAQIIQENLRKNPIRTANSTPIVIMVTAYSREELLGQSGITWVDGVLSKPVTPSALYNTITRIINAVERGGTVSEAEAPLPNQRLPGVRVLVVDDSDINRDVVQHILEADGARVNLAADGQEALDWLYSHPDAVDIVLMDIQMPRMDGYEATRHIRQEARWQKLPIIALTAGAFKSLRETAAAAGMDDFVAKPFDVGQLIAVIRHFTLERTAALASQVEPDTAADPSLLPGIDVAAGLGQWQDKAVYRTYLAKFTSAYGDAGRTISHCLETGDRAAAAALAHKLKGVAATLALTSVAAQAQAVDARLAAGEVFAAQTKAEALQAALDEVSLSLAQWQEVSTKGQKSPVLTTKPSSSAEVMVVLVQLLDALDQDSPSGVEPLLLKLQGQLAPEHLALLQNQVGDFDFRAAELSVRTLMATLIAD